MKLRSPAPSTVLVAAGKCGKKYMEDKCVSTEIRDSGNYKNNRDLPRSIGSCKSMLKLVTLKTDLMPKFSQLKVESVLKTMIFYLPIFPKSGQGEVLGRIMASFKYCV